MTNDKQSTPPNPPTSGGLVGLSQHLDALLRFFDLRARRTVGGWLDRRFRIRAHTAAALFLPAALCGLLVLGSPDPFRWLLALAASLVAGFVIVRLMRWSGERATHSVFVDLIVQTGTVMSVAGLVWFISGSEYRDGWPYRHALIPITVAVSIALLVGAALIGRLFAWAVDESKYAGYLKQTELFLSGSTPAPPSTWTLLASSAAVAFRAPLALLTFPAIATLVVPPVWIPLVPGVAAVLCALALLLSGANDRFGGMWLLLQEALSKGGALLVSLALVVLAVLRLADISYATTIFDSAAWSEIAVVFVAAYVLSWWFDYWLHRVLTDQVMRLLNGGTAGVTDIAYDIDADFKKTSVPVGGRRLQIHGAARFIAINEGCSDGRPPYFQAHLPMSMLELLAICGAPGGKAIPTPGQIYARIAGYKVATGLVLGAIVGIGIWHLHKGRQDPGAELQSTNKGVELKKLLMRQPAGDAPIIVLAASGGGTRAAVYTAAVLEGIARHGKAGNVVLGSGVSGGGAALAYFAGRRGDLIAANSGEAWTEYFHIMTKPYIQDVLERSTEWRMISSGRLGTLLAESFERRWKLPENSRHVSSIEEMGLILNTSLAGHFQRPASAPADSPLKDVEPQYRERTTSTLAGGRLLLTNLSLPETLAGKPLEPDATLSQLPVIVRSSQLRLEQAAALNANFPPVFSNAAIDLDKVKRFWVTDGGAVDNRGMEMLLYSVRLALKDIAKDRGRLPRLHIVVADASAFSRAYVQDRGLSSMAGGGARFASHLDAELVEAIKTTYKEANLSDHFNFSYLMMPDLLRESGSFGTHWMLQERIRVRRVPDPMKPEEGPKETVVLSGAEMVDVIRALHTGASADLKPDACKVLHWSRQEGGHRDGWNAVLAALGGSDVLPTCKLE